MSISKTCSFCKRELPLEMFGVKVDGRFGKKSTCKPCEVEKNAQYRKTDAGRQALAEYRSRPEVKAQIKEANKRWISKPGNLELKKKLDAKFPDRVLARRMVTKAVRTGVLAPLPCFVCGAKAEAHHPDYSRPLDVTWLCPAHHKEVHAMKAAA